MKILAIDGAVLGINGTEIPIPKGTEFNIAKSNKKGRAVTEVEMNGDGSSTPIFSKIRGHISGMVLRISTEAHEDLFTESFGEAEHQLTISNGDAIYSIAKGILKSPQADSTPEINAIKRTTEAFEIISANGLIIQRKIVS